ncbi:MAG: hypothetical protein PUP91_26705 [Rhizonema sp. PD37]|nr:hypothetical protein [Rhizonema sp. PD37]
MVKLDPTTINECVEILRPFVETEKERQSFLIAALGNDAPVLQYISWDGSVATFIPHLVHKLANYGGIQALCTVLEYVRSQMSVHENVQQRIDKLHMMINLHSQSMNELLTVDKNFLSLVLLCLDTAEQRQKSGKLSEKQQAEMNILKQKLSSLITISEQLADMASQAQNFIKETKQIIEVEVETLRSLSSKSNQEILQQKTEQDELEKKIAALEDQLKILRQFEKNLEIGKKAARWLDDNRQILAKKAGDASLCKYKDLRSSFSTDDIDDFYWELEQYLERISHCLTWGKYDILDEPDMLTLPAYAYDMAFRFIKDQRIPQSMSKEVATQLKDCINYLIERLS